MVGKSMLQGNFETVRARHKEWREMSDEEFAETMRREVWNVAQCHPLASALMGPLPGTDYLAPLNVVTAVPGSLDRKATYSIWAYSYMYRSLIEYIDEAKRNLAGSTDALGAGTQAMPPAVTDGARKIVQLFPNLAPKLGLDASPGSRGASADSGDESTSSDVSGNGLPPDLDLDSAERLRKRMEGVTPQEVVDGLGGDVIRDWLQDEGVEQVSGDVGPVRPTIPVYALQGRELLMYEINSVHLMFSGGTGPAKFCYERYNPEYPPFARLFAAGKATQKAVATLSGEEAAEIMKFFNAGAKVEADSFLLADRVAIAAGVSEEATASALASCVRQAQKDKRNEGNGSPDWLRGSVVQFESEDKIWQSLMMMLAAKRIEVAQDQIAQ